MFAVFKLESHWDALEIARAMANAPDGFGAGCFNGSGDWVVPRDDISWHDDSEWIRECWTYYGEVRKTNKTYMLVRLENPEHQTYALGWQTCGGSLYYLKQIEGTWYLQFEGSRASFETGCSPLYITKDYVYLYDTREQVPHSLYYWESTVPGNPSPFEDWRKILDTLVDPVVNYWDAVGEEIEFSY